VLDPKNTWNLSNRWGWGVDGKGEVYKWPGKPGNGFRRWARRSEAVLFTPFS